MGGHSDGSSESDFSDSEEGNMAPKINVFDRSYNDNQMLQYYMYFFVLG